MSVKLPHKLPALDLLKEENIYVSGDSAGPAESSASTLKVVILNLMPLKIPTETDFIRLLSNTALSLEVKFMRLHNHISKHTPAEHMDAFYQYFHQLKDDYFDGMIITGAPVEHLDFEQVDYWEELTGIFDWARTHVASTMYICWAAQAGLYYHYGIPKYQLEKKKFGIFPHTICPGFEKIPLFRGFDDVFYVPHSRHTEIRREDIEKCSLLHILSESAESGVHIIMARQGREFYITGHSEYGPLALDTEYKRDLGKGLPIEMPQHYYRDDNPEHGPCVRWRSTAHLLVANWLHYYVEKLNVSFSRSIK